MYDEFCTNLAYLNARQRADCVAANAVETRVYDSRRLLHHAVQNAKAVQNSTWCKTTW